jgi:hypothetical protein
MSTTTTTTRSRLARRLRRGAVIAALAGAALAAAPAPAQAGYSGYGLTLTPGSTACVGAYASYQVRGEGFADRQGAKFTLYKDGALVQSSFGSVPNYAVERRSSLGNFPGAGFYTFCAKNNKDTNTLVNIYIYTDGNLW